MVVRPRVHSPADYRCGCHCSLVRSDVARNLYTVLYSTELENARVTDCDCWIYSSTAGDARLAAFVFNAAAARRSRARRGGRTHEHFIGVADRLLEWLRYVRGITASESFLTHHRTATRAPCLGNSDPGPPWPSKVSRAALNTRAHDGDGVHHQGGDVVGI